MTCVLGIDCGVTGAIALLGEEGGLIEVHDMPIVDKTVSPLLLGDSLDGLVACYGIPTLAVVERLHAMPPPVGSKANFSKGFSYGVVLGALAAINCPVELPTPAAWKREMGVSSDKDAARAHALNAWPDKSALFARKKDADRAEAALLAEYGRRLLNVRGRLLEAGVSA